MVAGNSGVDRFRNNCELMHGELRKWHYHNFSEIEQQLQFCKKTILFFDQIEEIRMLQGYERKFQIMVRERAYKLACIIESRWQHRSRCKWLKAGDKNTQYFHAMASARHWRNQISTLIHGTDLLTDEEGIRAVFKGHMEELLGIDSNVIPFKPETLYQANQTLSQLEVPITEVEIEMAIKQLAKNKAFGPNGLPNEFLQVHWPILKNEIMDIMWICHVLTKLISL